MKTFQLAIPLVEWESFSRNFTLNSPVPLVPSPITLSGLTAALVGSRYIATATSGSAHGLQTGQTVTISGVTPSGYNKTAVVTVTGTNTFTYVVDSALANSTVHGQAQALIEFQQAIVVNTDSTNSLDLYLTAGGYPMSIPAQGQFLVQAPARTKMYLNNIQVACPMAETPVTVYYV
jgi:hypothetical protein